ncbi:hypothetical protein D8N35_14005 [Enterococcus casseliflavus]|nr:hypothetical protein D8N35_14005 [Enterococcus casseliflavus]
MRELITHDWNFLPQKAQSRFCFTVFNKKSDDRFEASDFFYENIQITKGKFVKSNLTEKSARWYDHQTLLAYNFVR